MREIVHINERLCCWAKPSQTLIDAEKQRLQVRNNRRKAWLSNSDKIRPASLRNILKHQEYLCFYCNQSIEESWHFDHFIPVSRGGKHIISNIVASCPVCNLRKADAMPSSRLLAMLYERNS